MVDIQVKALLTNTFPRHFKRVSKSYLTEKLNKHNAAVMANKFGFPISETAQQQQHVILSTLPLKEIVFLIFTLFLFKNIVERVRARTATT